MRGEAGLPELGLVEWFRPGDHDHVARSLDRLQALGIARLRTHLSWAEYHREGGAAWYDWLIPTLARSVELLPCLHYTPPSLSETGRSSGPPRRLLDFADFVDEILTRYDGAFHTVELWNEPNNLLDWDWRVDADWLKFCEMIGAAAHWARRRGRRVVLAGPAPMDLAWLDLMGERGILGTVDVVGVHGFPGTWESEEATWHGWAPLIAQVRTIARRHNPALDIWITETGYSTWRHDQIGQVERMLDALRAPVDRLYWYGLEDIPPAVPVQEGLRFDQRHYHFGLYEAQGREKLLARTLRTGGIAALGTAVGRSSAPACASTRPILITGGAGFIGTNLADRLAAEGHSVLILDALSREGVESNLDWLRRRHPTRIAAVIADIRDAHAVEDAATEAEAVFHFAAQVAVTTSLDHPLEDFDVNARGTLLLLEALRRRGGTVPLVFASTNKVYGDLADIPLEREGEAYRPLDPSLRAHGVPETRPLDFHTPYGCSKGAADQYVLDYARSFGLPAAVMRMSCIYGPRQMGNEDQGWVAHFLIRALAGDPITIFGDGCQVRDVLHVRDAVDAYLAAWRRMDLARGRAFNLGGGPANAVSLRQVISQIEARLGCPVATRHAGWRAGDQRYYVSDTRQARRILGLGEPLGWRTGLATLAEWLEHATETRPTLTTRPAAARTVEASA